MEIVSACCALRVTSIWKKTNFKIKVNKNQAKENNLNNFLRIKCDLMHQDKYINRVNIFAAN